MIVIYTPQLGTDLLCYAAVLKILTYVLCSILCSCKRFVLKSDCSIRVYINFSQTLYIMLALCLMLLATYYAQNYAGIIGWSVPPGPSPLLNIAHT